MKDRQNTTKTPQTPEQKGFGFYDTAEVRERFNLVSYLQSRGVQFGKANSKGYYRCSCFVPGHEDSNPSCDVSPTHFHCHGCGAKGDGIRAIEVFHNNISFSEAIKMAGEFAGVKPQTRRESEPATEIPELALLPDDADAPLDQDEATYIYSETQKITRTRKADGKKKFTQYSFQDGAWATSAGENLWPLWREAEAYAATGKWVFMAEGEKSAEALRRRGYVALSPRGSARAEEIEQSLTNLKSCGVAGILYWPDKDAAGVNKAEKIQASCERVGMSNLTLNPDDFEGLPDAGDAADLADWNQLRFVNILSIAITRAVRKKHKPLQPEIKGFQEPKETSKVNIREVVKRCRKVLLDENIPEIEKEILCAEIADESGVKHYVLEKFLKPLRREVRQTRFDLEIKALLLYESVYDQYKAMMEMSISYSMPINSIRICMERMKAAMRTPDVKSELLDDRILTSINQPKEWLIKGLLGKGKTLLLNAKAKSGKSRFATQLAYDLALAVGGNKSEFLGYEIEPGDGGVLYIHPDEDKSDLDARFLDLGYRPGMGGIHTVADWQITQLPALEKLLEDKKPRLVIIDSLFAVSHPAGIEEKSPEFGVLVADLVLLMQKYQTACVMIHHSAKAADQWAANDINSGRGSSAIAGAVWGVLNLIIPQTKDDESQRNVEVRDGTRMLYGKLRGVSDDIRIKLKANWLTSGFDVEEIDDEDSVNRKTYGERILRILQLNKNTIQNGQKAGYLTAGQIIDLMAGEETNKNSVYRALTRLHELGDVEKHWDMKSSAKYYCLPQPKPEPEPTPDPEPVKAEVAVQDSPQQQEEVAQTAESTTTLTASLNVEKTLKDGVKNGWWSEASLLEILTYSTETQWQDKSIEVIDFATIAPDKLDETYKTLYAMYQEKTQS